MSYYFYFWGLFSNLDCIVQNSSVQTFQSIFLVYRRGSFGMFINLSSIVLSLRSYPWDRQQREVNPLSRNHLTCEVSKNISIFVNFNTFPVNLKHEIVQKRGHSIIHACCWATLYISTKLILLWNKISGRNVWTLISINQTIKIQ